MVDFITVDFITENWIPLVVAVMALIKVIVNLTPTESDNAVFGYLDILITAITGDRRKK
jgi:hypothetical protein